MEQRSSPIYETLAIELVKRDLLLEAVRDAYFLFALPDQISRLGVEEPLAANFANRLLLELIDGGYVELTDNSGKLITRDELLASSKTIPDIIRSDRNDFTTHAVAPTAMARDWVARYWALIREIHDESCGSV